MPEVKPTIEEQMKRLNTVRKRVDEVKADKQRLEGRIESQKKSLSDLDVKCKEQFGCAIDELEPLAKQLEEEAEALLKSAEETLERAS